MADTSPQGTPFPRTNGVRYWEVSLYFQAPLSVLVKESGSNKQTNKQTHTFGCVDVPVIEEKWFPLTNCIVEHISRYLHLTFCCLLWLFLFGLATTQLQQLSINKMLRQSFSYRSNVLVPGGVLPTAIQGLYISKSTTKSVQWLSCLLLGNTSYTNLFYGLCQKNIVPSS